jgi:hypothetical protein
MKPVDAEAGAVVFDHTVDRCRIVDRGAIVGVVLGPHAIGRIAVPRIRVSEDRSLGLFQLTEKEPMQPSLRKAGRAPLKGLDDGNPIKHGEMSDGKRVVHCSAKSCVGAAVMSNNRKALEAKLLHQCHTIARLGALGRATVIPGVCRLRRLTEAA